MFTSFSISSLLRTMEIMLYPKMYDGIFGIYRLFDSICIFPFSVSPNIDQFLLCILRKPTVGFAEQNGRPNEHFSTMRRSKLTTRGLRWEVGVVALPQRPAQWTPIRMASTGLALKAGYPRRQGPDVNPQRKISV